MKEFIIYQKGETVVYIHDLPTPKGCKLPVYGISRDDETGISQGLGIISFNGRWRQYTTKFASNTEWSSGCKKKICEFEDNINLQWRMGLR